MVVINAPPNDVPSNTTGANCARAAYNAAVYPAGPEPIMITSWMSEELISGHTTVSPANPSGRQGNAVKQRTQREVVPSQHVTSTDAGATRALWNRAPWVQ
ncbi:hypothetical protein MPRI_38850 [Mycobacterium paraintracellulare]|uniref:Uncharacterized protein n=1 Tax=Mycobacterium paraintracellulare TaxID=1138383 RepID=A0ABM7KCB8_9MYCO|nr:hypothetical protein MPRI_38850 [Mycobacterium paraintracellulare]